MGFNPLVRFMSWSIKANACFELGPPAGHWWHPLLLKEAALAAHVRMQPPELMAKDYMFHNTGYLYRPLWTYQAEEQGSRVLFYFYSTNCEPFKRPDGYPPLPYAWELMNWPHYLVWDTYQEEFVRRAVGERGDIHVVGPIWFLAAQRNCLLSVAGDCRI